MSPVPDSCVDGGFDGISSLCSPSFMSSSVDDGVNMTADGFGATLVGLFAGACVVVGIKGRSGNFSADLEDGGRKYLTAAISALGYILCHTDPTNRRAGFFVPIKSVAALRNRDHRFH